MQTTAPLLKLRAHRNAKGKVGAASASAAATGGRTHGLLTEEEEDENIIQDELREDEPQWPTHFERQPSCIDPSPYSNVTALVYARGWLDSSSLGYPPFSSTYLAAHTRDVLTPAARH
jgi:hypothetical protein